jgi:hypothetical protein
MDFKHPDVIIDMGEHTLFQMRLKFPGNIIVSPNEIFEQVQKLAMNNWKEIRPKVGRLGELFLGGNYGGPLFFTFGFYFRKAVEALEKKYKGECEIQWETEELNTEQIKTFVSHLLKKQAERLVAVSQQILKEGIPDNYLDE